MGVCGIFASHFRRKKAVCSSCLVLGCAEPRSHWIQKGRGLDGLSRLKGIETYILAFPEKHSSHCLDGLSRLKGIETSHYPPLSDLPPWRLDGLSRLKGIETRNDLSAGLQD